MNSKLNILRRGALVSALLALWLIGGRPADAAIVITQNTDANTLATAATAFGGAGMVVTSATLSGHTQVGATSSGTFTANGATYGLFGTGIVLSTGNVSDYEDGPNTSPGQGTIYGVAATAPQNALLTPITGQASHFDVTELTIAFDLLAGFDTVFFNVVFGSEEFPEFVGGAFIDGFGLFVNGTNIASVGGFPVNINHPDMMALAGTELDGVLAPGGNPILTFSAFIGDGATGNELKFIVADAVDADVDTTVYISSLGGSLPPPPPGAEVPEPASVLLWGFGLACLAYIRRRTALKRPVA